MRIAINIISGFIAGVVTFNLVAAWGYGIPMPMWGALMGAFAMGWFGRRLMEDGAGH